MGLVVSKLCEWRDTNGGVKSATKVLREDLVVKATLRHKIDKRKKHVEAVVSIGRPNFEERKLIKNYKGYCREDSGALIGRKDKKFFPIHGVILHFPALRRASKSWIETK